MSGGLEGFGKKVAAKIHETLETGKAVEHLSPEQRMLSLQRQRATEFLKESRVSFEEDAVIFDEKIAEDKRKDFDKRIFPSVISAGTDVYHTKGVFDGKDVEMFYTKSHIAGETHLDSRICFINGIESSLKEKVDETFEKYYPIAEAVAIKNSTSV